MIHKIFKDHSSCDDSRGDGAEELVSQLEIQVCVRHDASPGGPGG